MNCDEMAGNRLTVCEQELLQAFARLVSISLIFFGFLPLCTTFLKLWVEYRLRDNVVNCNTAILTFLAFSVCRVYTRHFLEVLEF